MHLRQKTISLDIGKSRTVTRARPRRISTGQLHASQRFHLRPISPVFSGTPYFPLGNGVSHLEGGFPLRCLQRLSVPNIATRRMQLASQPVHQRFVHFGPLVLEADLLKYPTPVVDRDRTVSRRSKPSSRTALMGEQTNPWDLLQPQDAMSRHRGAKPPRRCELLGEISLLSPG